MKNNNTFSQFDVYDPYYEDISTIPDLYTLLDDFDEQVKNINNYFDSTFKEAVLRLDKVAKEIHLSRSFILMSKTIENLENMNSSFYKLISENIEGLKEMTQYINNLTDCYEIMKSKYNINTQFEEDYLSEEEEDILSKTIEEMKSVSLKTYFKPLELFEFIEQNVSKGIDELTEFSEERLNFLKNNLTTFLVSLFLNVLTSLICNAILVANYKIHDTLAEPMFSFVPLEKNIDEQTI